MNYLLMLFFISFSTMGLASELGKEKASTAEWIYHRLLIKGFEVDVYPTIHHIEVSSIKCLQNEIKPRISHCSANDHTKKERIDFEIIDFISIIKKEIPSAVSQFTKNDKVYDYISFLKCSKNFLLPSFHKVTNFSASDMYTCIVEAKIK